MRTAPIREHEHFLTILVEARLDEIGEPESTVLDIVSPSI